MFHYQPYATVQNTPFKPHPLRFLLFIGTMLCMGAIMLGMVITSPRRKGDRHE